MSKKKYKPFLFSIIISTRCQGSFINDCLNSIENAQAKVYENYNEQPYQVVILVDGKPIDQEVYNKIKEFAKDKFWFTILEHDKFDSLSGAWNYAIKSSKGEFVCVLNDDTIVHDKWLDILYAGWDQIIKDGALQEKKIQPGLIVPTISTAFLKINVREKPIGIPDGRLLHLQKLKEYPAGVCYFTSREIIEKLGFFDEAYKDFSAEDADFCYKVWDAGYDIFVDERVWIQHIHNATTKNATNGDDVKRKQIYERNGKQFVKKWAKYFSKTLPAPSKITEHISDNELVSIVIPVLDGDKFIENCIASVLNQSYKNLEVIVLDAGSSDKTSHVVSEMAEKDKRLKLIRDQRMPYAQAYRKVFDLANGTYVGAIQSDDWMHETAVEKCVAKLRSDENSSMVYTNCIDCDPELKPVGQTEKTKTLYSSLMMICNFMIPDFRLYKSNVYKTIAKNWNMIGEYMPDYDLILRISELKEFQVLFIDEFLYYKRFRTNGMHARFCLEQLLDMKKCAEAALERRGLAQDGYYLTHEASLKSNLNKGGIVNASYREDRNTPENWDTINEVCFQGKRNIYNRPDGRSRINEFKEMIKTLSKESVVLDVGCGNGEFLGLLLNEGFDPKNLYGIDISSKAIVNARNKYPQIPAENILQKNIYEKLENNKFDVIICTQLLEHLKKPHNAIRYMKNALRESGRLIISIPAEMDNRYDLEAMNVNFWKNREEYDGFINTFGMEVKDRTSEFGVAGSIIHELKKSPIRGLTEKENYERLKQCKENADITVFMPMFNREKYIKQAVRSMQHQTHENFILRIYDDFSNDKSCEIVEELMKTDPRIELIKMPSKTGITPLYAIMYDTATTKYFCQVDSDDYIAPSTLEITRNYLEQNEKIGVAFTDYISTSEDDKLQSVGDRTKMVFSMENMLEYFMSFQFRLQRVSAWKAIDRTDYPAKVIDETGKELIATKGPDYELCVRLSEVTRFERVAYPCYYYRQHEQTINSLDKDGQRRSSWVIIECAKKRRAKKFKI